MVIKGRRTDGCSECGGRVFREKWDRDEEGWIWCRKCGLVENDGHKLKLDELSIEQWFNLIKKIRPDIKIRELRKFSDVRHRQKTLKNLQLVW